MKTEEIEIVVEMKHETDMALLVSDGVSETWLPKSQIEYDTPDKYNVITVTLPEWLAEEKGLL